MSQELLISITSKDEVGIIANISKTIEKLKGNLGDLSQNVLDGYFSMILLASFPKNYSIADIKSDLIKNYSEFTKEDFSILVWPVTKTKASIQLSDPDEKYVLSASAKDRKGLVAELSAFCAKNRLNILSLDTVIRNGVYNMIFFLKAQEATSIKEIKKNLNLIENKSNIKLMFQHYKIFKATNEITI